MECNKTAAFIGLLVGSRRRASPVYDDGDTQFVLSHVGMVVSRVAVCSQQQQQMLSASCCL